MTDFIAWSHSRRKDYLECPRMLYHKSVAKKGHPDRVEFVQTKAQADGTAIDDALTARISKGTPLPPQYAPYEGMVAAVIAAPGAKFTQMKLTLDRDFKLCGWFDSDAWVRAIYDVAVINGAHGFLGDWKNGQVWIDEDQLKLFAAAGFLAFPELEVIDTAYIWLKHGRTSDKTYTRRELPDLWADLLPDVERMQISYRTNHWPANPKRGKGTCKWCPANQVGKCAEAQGPYGK